MLAIFRSIEGTRIFAALSAANSAAEAGVQSITSQTGMALSRSQVLSGAVFAEFGSEDVSGFLHEFVAMAAAFEDAGFEAAGRLATSQAAICASIARQ